MDRLQVVVSNLAGFGYSLVAGQRIAAAEPLLQVGAPPPPGPAPP